MVKFYGIGFHGFICPLISAKVSGQCCVQSINGRLKLYSPAGGLCVHLFGFLPPITEEAGEYSIGAVGKIIIKDTANHGERSGIGIFGRGPAVLYSVGLGAGAKCRRVAHITHVTARFWLVGCMFHPRYFPLTPLPLLSLLSTLPHPVLWPTMRIIIVVSSFPVADICKISESSHQHWSSG